MENLPEEGEEGGVGHSEGPTEREAAAIALQSSQDQTSTE